MILPPAILNAADRLIATLMTLVDAIHPIALGGSTPTFPDHAAKILFFRLAHLVTTLIRISNFGIRATAKLATPKAGTEPAPIAKRSNPGPAQTLPRHPGWLLAALPDLAPAIAADLAALLADPALTTFFAATPTLHRSLRPLLRSLGLTQSPDPQSPDPQSPDPPSPDPGSPDPSPRLHPQPPHPAQPGLTQPLPAIEAAASNRPDRVNRFHANFVTITQ